MILKECSFCNFLTLGCVLIRESISTYFWSIKKIFNCKIIYRYTFLHSWLILPTVKRIRDLHPIAYIHA